MIKTMLSGTAVALLLAASPVLAQTTDQLEEEQVQTDTQTQEAPAIPEAPDADDETAEFDAPDADDDTAEFDAPDAPDTEAAETEPLDAPDTGAAELDTDIDEADVAEAPAAPTETFLSMQEDDDILASELMDANVENPEGESLGSIRDVLINDELGVKAVVIGVGGFLGIGQKSVAVNYQEIQEVRENGEVTLVFSATRDQLDEAPEFQTLSDQIAAAEREQMEMEQQQQMQTDQPAAPLD